MKARHKHNQTTISISVEQASTTSQLLSNSQRYKRSKNNLSIPEAEISNLKPLHKMEDTGSIVESEAKCMLQIDDEIHPIISQPHQKHPTSNDIHVSKNIQHKRITTHNPCSTIENDKQQYTTSNVTHSEENITPPCSIAKHKANSLLKWDELHPSLQKVLPPDDDYSYVVETYQEINSGIGDSPHFSATIRINLANEDDAKQWIEKMSSHSLCTYRTTKTVKTSNKRVKCKFVKHCQHFAKKLSQKQKEKSALSAAKRKAKVPLSSQLRNKKTNCSSSFTLTVQIPTKAQKIKAESQPHLLSHRGILKITFNHNHPIKAAHTLSFRDVSTDTKKELTDLFEMGHNASSARHAHEQQLLHEAEMNKQVTLADRAQNPNPQDVYRRYGKWRQGSYGNDNGKGLFEKLQQAVDTYNSQNDDGHGGGGQVVLQWYDACKGQASEASDSDGEEVELPTKKKGRSLRLIPCP